MGEDISLDLCEGAKGHSGYDDGGAVVSDARDLAEVKGKGVDHGEDAVFFRDIGHCEEDGGVEDLFVGKKERVKRIRERENYPPV